MKWTHHGILFHILAELHVELIMKWHKLPLITPVVVALSRSSSHSHRQLRETWYIIVREFMRDNFSLATRAYRFSGDVIWDELKVHFSQSFQARKTLHCFSERLVNKLWIISSCTPRWNWSEKISERIQQHNKLYPTNAHKLTQNNSWGPSALRLFWNRRESERRQPLWRLEYYFININ